VSTLNMERGRFQTATYQRNCYRNRAP